MGKHYTRSTVSASAWCNKCEKHTQHRVDDRRLGPCLECMDRLEAEHDQRKMETPVAQQKGLFE